MIQVKTVKMQHTNGQVFDVPKGYLSLTQYLSVVELNLNILNKMIERGEGSPTAPQTAKEYEQILNLAK